MTNEFMYTPEQVGALVYLSEPVLFIREEQVAYRNPAAAALIRTDESSLAAFLSPDDLELYRKYQGGAPLELVMELGGRRYSTTVHRDGAHDVFISQPKPMYETMSLDTLAVAAQILRTSLNDQFDVAGSLFPRLEEMEDPRIQKDTARLSRSLFQLLRLAANLGDASRAIAGESKAYLARTEITEFFGQLCDRAAVLCDAMAIDLQYHCPARTFFAAIDRQKMERALLNLLSNAIRFTPQGGKIIVRLENLGGTFHLRVSDNGEGIPAEMLSSIFDRYEHRDQLGDPRWGIGLGLPLVRHIANLHGGTVIVNSAPGAGTAVTMSVSRNLTPSPKDQVNSPIFNYDYAGGYDHVLLELSDALRSALFDSTSFG